MLTAFRLPVCSNGDRAVLCDVCVTLTVVLKGRAVWQAVASAEPEWRECPCNCVCGIYCEAWQR